MQSEDGVLRSGVAAAGPHCSGAALQVEQGWPGRVHLHCWAAWVSLVLEASETCNQGCPVLGVQFPVLPDKVGWIYVFIIIIIIWSSYPMGSHVQNPT